MLNISNNQVPQDKIATYSAFDRIQCLTIPKIVIWSSLVIVILMIIAAFLPWTQTLNTKGKITALYPEQRPQKVYPTIGGRVDKWFVREGDLVKKGDTIVLLSEIKTDYFDDKLVDRTEAQLRAKSSSVDAYNSKANALEQQILALQNTLDLKRNQLENKLQQQYLKITADSAALQNALNKLDIARIQFYRTDTLYARGLKSRTELENKRQKQQEALANKIAKENKLLATRNEATIIQIELSRINAEYADKVAKARSNQYSSLSSAYDATSQVSKLENQLANYEKRSEQYVVLAPQSGYITDLYKEGLGEIIKEGEAILSIVPKNHQLAIEMEIAPMDYPLLKKGQKVQIFFDGWPAFIFSGWPEMSSGNFLGKVNTIDNVANKKNMFRIMVVEDNSDPKRKWPSALRMGSGAQGYILLEDVPIWYELWRQLNGFPPEYYKEREREKLKMKPAANQFKK
ncbi:MAG: HlyD family secretion protein [Saprospiraceae bacterium]|nr:HlyD family secretion protein [Saprospiraceae bacterium]